MTTGGVHTSPGRLLSLPWTSRPGLLADGDMNNGSGVVVHFQCVLLSDLSTAPVKEGQLSSPFHRGVNRGPEEAATSHSEPYSKSGCKLIQRCAPSPGCGWGPEGYSLGLPEGHASSHVTPGLLGDSQREGRRLGRKMQEGPPPHLMILTGFLSAHSTFHIRI